MGHKGYYGQYSGNSKFSKDHAHTRVTSGNYKATERDDAAHIDYLKRDIDYDNKHGHSDEKMTADEKHISKLAGDMKYDKKHHSPAKHLDSSAHEKMSNDEFVKHYKEEDHGSPTKRAQDGMSHEEMGKSPKALKMHIDKHPHHTGLSMNSPAKNIEDKIDPALVAEAVESFDIRRPQTQGDSIQLTGTMRKMGSSPQSETDSRLRFYEKAGPKGGLKSMQERIAEKKLKK